MLKHIAILLALVIATPAVAQNGDPFSGARSITIVMKREKAHVVRRHPRLPQVVRR